MLTDFFFFFLDPKVKVIFVNVFGGIVNCATIARGIIAASRNLGLQIPLVVRLEGKVSQFLFFLSHIRITEKLNSSKFSFLIV